MWVFQQIPLWCWWFVSQLPSKVDIKPMGEQGYVWPFGGPAQYAQPTRDGFWVPKQKQEKNK